MYRLVKILLNFITRTVFIYTLSNEFVGLNGLFLNILQVFSLTDLGIGVSIAYCLYKPVANGDEYATNALMTLFSKLYKMVALVIVVLGVLTLPFVHLLIKDNPFDVNYLRIILMLFVTEAAASYLLSYRSMILIVNEKSYIINSARIFTTVFIFVFQIIMLITTKNYIAFKIADIAIHIISNICLYIIAAKSYPNVKIGNKYLVSKTDKAVLINRIKCASLSRISNVATNFTDTLFISFFFGVYETGLFSNYNLIITTSIYSVITKVLDGAAAGLGNLIAKGNDIKKDFYKFYFIGFWISSFSFTALFILINPFIKLWIGDENILPFSTVLVMLINFYILGISYVVTIMRESAGLFVYDKNVSILKPIINLVASFILIKCFGLIGVFLGTLVSCIVCDLILFPLYLYRYLLKENFIEYYKRYTVYIFVTGINTAFCSVICGNMLNIEAAPITIFAGLCLACLIVPNVIIALVFRNTEEFLYLRTLVKKISNKPS